MLASTVVSFAVLLSWLWLACSAAPLYASWALPRLSASAGWQHHGPSLDTHAHTVVLALKQSNLEQLHSTHAQIHDPDHPRWLRHLSIEQLHTITALPAAEMDTIVAWLLESGVVTHEILYPVASDTLRVTTAVLNLNRAFNTTLHRFSRTIHGREYTIHRQVGASSLPDHIAAAGSIVFVDGLVKFPLKARGFGHRRSMTESGNNYAGCSFAAIFPVNSLYKWYEMPDRSSLAESTRPVTSASVLQFWTEDANGNPQPNSMAPNDLALYSRLWSQSSNRQALRVNSINGPNNATYPTTEPSLDVQSMTSFNPLASQNFELTPDLDTFAYGWASSFVSRTNIPQVVSISYGVDEAIYASYGSGYEDDGLDFTVYLDRTNTELLKISGSHHGVVER
jgi:hypothetical protein